MSLSTHFHKYLVQYAYLAEEEPEPGPEECAETAMEAAQPNAVAFFVLCVDCGAGEHVKSLTDDMIEAMQNIAYAAVQHSKGPKGKGKG